MTLHVAEWRGVWGRGEEMPRVGGGSCREGGDGLYRQILEVAEIYLGDR